MKLPKHRSRLWELCAGNLKSQTALGDALGFGFSDRGSTPLASTIQGLSEPFLPKEWVRIFSYLGRTGVGRIEGRHGWFCPCRFLFPYPLSPDSFPVPHRMLRKSQLNIRINIYNSQSFGWDYFFIRRNSTWQSTIPSTPRNA